MATIVNNPGPSERVIERVDSGDSTAGWAVAIIILIAVIAGIFAWVHYHRAYAPAAPGATINVTLPSTNSGGTGGTGGTGGGP